jgi:ankyrin repeat protein
MPLLNLVNKLLLSISENLESERDINAFSQTNRRLHSVLNTYLYRYNVLRLGSLGLCWATQHGHEIAVQRFLEVKLMLEKSANVDPKDYRSWTPLS